MTYFLWQGQLWSHRLFNGKNVKALDFSGSFVACDLKVGTYIQLIELMKSYEYSRSRLSLDIGQRSFTYC